MRRAMQLFLRFCLLLFPGLLFSQNSITLEDIWMNGNLNTKGVPGFNFRNDGVHYTRRAGDAILQYDLRTGELAGTVFDAAAVSRFDEGWKGKFDGYAFSADESKILLSTNTESIYRWSKKADYYVYDPASGLITRLYQGEKQRYATFSPDGSKIAFVAGNDLYYKDLASGKITRVSTDGKVNEIINGASDWVYEEEFELVRAFEWSPDGSRIAFLRFDEREVPEFTMDMYRGGEYPEPVTFKYPKVGEKNSIVSAHIYTLATAKTIAVDVPGREKDPDGRLDDYLPRIAWTPGNQLCLTWMNRHQSHQKLLLADSNTGQCSMLLEEKNKYYLDLHDVTFLADGSGFILQSEKSGFNHLYKYDMQGKETAALTKGDWELTDFYGVDEKNGLVYFQGAKESPLKRELYSVKLNGKGMKKISKEDGTNSAQFSSTFDYYVNTNSSINTPPRYDVMDRKGRRVRALEDNKSLAAKQAEYGAANVSFFDFTTSENVKLNGWMIRPEGAQYQGQQLPVLMYVYGGPGNQQVTDAWKGANYWWFQMLAQQGYVVACVDNRGTGGRGEEFKKMTYKQLGHYETMDQIEAAKYLGDLPFVDKNRIGIFGWSYGGYMSSLCLLKGKDVFKSAIAVAPVTNWKWYDSIYTERYMQTNEENSDGYEENSPVNFVDQLEGNYLLVHGLADDNVHFQQSAEMANQLIAKNKQYETMIYPNRNHSIPDKKARLHLYKLMTSFLDKKLKNAPSEEIRP
ncbi:MAG: S9 family peptidase [Lewinellaceae bacterium]|nr:S9 family peptidase [Lewinellaceae bacterium]